MSNDAVFQAAKRKIWDLVWPNLREAIVGLAADLIQSAELEKGYSNLTGNTLTSYAIGIYKDGVVSDILVNDNVMPPVHVKFTAGKVYKNFYDYDGVFHESVSVPIPTDETYGRDTSVGFLMGYTPPFTKPSVGFVMCTGTEYSEYLEYYGRNVLTATRDEFKALGEKMLLRNLKPIK